MVPIVKRYICIKKNLQQEGALKIFMGQHHCWICNEIKKAFVLDNNYKTFSQKFVHSFPST